MKKFLFLALIAVACNPAKKSTTTSANTTPQAPATPPASVIVDGKLFASIYQQKAAEYRALCFQAYNLAIARLDEALAKKKDNRPVAVITDIDETVLDNSMYQINRSLQGKDYESLSWSQWIERAEADTVPGAAHFLKYCASKRVEVYYVTNRDEKDRNGTTKSLEVFNLPFADDRHIVMRQGNSSKEARRQEIMSAYNVLLLIGDNLSDFTGDFDKKNMEERETYTNKMTNEFGTRFILIPNPVYGDWESAIYNNNNSFSLHEKDSIIKTVGKTY